VRLFVCVCVCVCLCVPYCSFLPRERKEKKKKKERGAFTAGSQSSPGSCAKEPQTHVSHVCKRDLHTCQTTREVSVYTSLLQIYVSFAFLGLYCVYKSLLHIPRKCRMCVVCVCVFVCWSQVCAKEKNTNTHNAHKTPGKCLQIFFACIWVFFAYIYAKKIGLCTCRSLLLVRTENTVHTHTHTTHTPHTHHTHTAHTPHTHHTHTTHTPHTHHTHTACTQAHTQYSEYCDTVYTYICTSPVIHTNGWSHTYESNTTRVTWLIHFFLQWHDSFFEFVTSCVLQYRTRQ